MIKMISFFICMVVLSLGIFGFKMLTPKYELTGQTGAYDLYRDTSVTIFNQALEKIGEDKDYVYYIKVNFRLIPIRNALSLNLITVQDLNKALGKEIIKEEKNG